MEGSAYSGQEAQEKTLRQIRDSLPAYPETGLSKEATQLSVKSVLDEIKIDTDSLDVALSTRLKPSDTLSKVSTIDTITNPVAVNGTFWQTTQPISGTVAVSNMIPSVETGLAKDGVDITTPTAMPAGGVGIRGWLSAIWTKLNGSLAVTGTFWQATQPVSVTSLPLPTNAAQETGGNLDGIKTQTDKLTFSSNDLDVKVNQELPTGTNSIGQVTANAGTNLNTSSLNLESTQSSIKTNLDEIALDTDNLSLIKGKTDNLDVLLSTRLKPADTLTAVTTVGTITNIVHVDDNGGSLTIDAVSLPLPTGAATDTTLTGGTAKSIIRGGQKGATNTNADITHTAEGADHEALDVQIYHGGVAKDPTQIRTLTSSDQITIVPSGTQTITGSVTANAGTNLNTSALNLEATQSLIKTKTDNIDVALSTRLKPADTLTKVATVDTITNVVHIDDNSGSITVDGPLTDAQLRASGVPVNATLSAETTKVIGTVNQGTSPWVTNDGTAPSSFRTTALTNASQSVKASSGDLWGWNFINLNSVPVYVKFYNTASGSVTVGVTAIVKVLMVPANGSAVFQSDKQSLQNFTTAISISCVTGLADNNTTAPTTSIYAEINYK